MTLKVVRVSDTVAVFTRATVPGAASACPSANVVPTTGIATPGSPSVPWIRMLRSSPSGTTWPSLKMIAAVAPAACALAALTANGHVPRCMQGDVAGREGREVRRLAAAGAAVRRRTGRQLEVDRRDGPLRLP